MNLKEILIYFIDKRDGYSNVSVSLNNEHTHVDGYESLLEQKYEKKEYIYKNDKIYIPTTWDDYHITKDLVELGNVIFLNTRDGGSELVIPKDITNKEIDDINMIKDQLKNFDLLLWEVDGNNITEYDRKDSLTVLEDKIKKQGIKL